MGSDFTRFLALPPADIIAKLPELYNEDIERALVGIPEEARANVWKAIEVYLGSTALSLFKQEVRYYEDDEHSGAEEARARILKVYFGGDG